MQGNNPYAAPSAPNYQGGPAGFGHMPVGNVGHRDGAHVVIPSGAPLPPVCVKCGVQHDLQLRNQKFQWIPMYGRFFGLLGMLLTRRTGALQLPICAACNQRWSQAGWAMAGAVVGGILLTVLFPIVLGAISPDVAGFGFMLGVLALLGLVLGVALGVVKPRQVQVHRIEKDGRIYLTGFHPNAATAITGS
jgi:hypothetical protein